MSKLHIKKGDTVYVNAGEDKGKTGRVLKVLVKEGRAFVDKLEYISPYRQTFVSLHFLHNLADE